MKKYLQFLGYLLLVAVVFMVIDFLAGKVFDQYLFLKNDPKLNYAYKGGGGEEIVVLGASRASHHYIPSVFQDSIGLSCYNYGMDGRNIFNQYVVANQLIKDKGKKPRIVILDISSIDIADSPGWNEEKLSNLYILYNKDKNVKEIIDKENKTVANVLKCLNLYRYNSDLLGLLFSIAKPPMNSDKDKGYVPLWREWEQDNEVVNNESTFIVHPGKEEYLRKLIVSVKDSDVELMVFNSPDFRFFTNPSEWDKHIQSICEEYGVPFINHERDTLFIKHKEWFNEPFHLNDKGARVYTSIVANEIQPYLDIE